MPTIACPSFRFKSQTIIKLRDNSDRLLGRRYYDGRQMPILIRMPRARWNKSTERERPLCLLQSTATILILRNHEHNQQGHLGEDQFHDVQMTKLRNKSYSLFSKKVETYKNSMCPSFQALCPCCVFFGPSDMVFLENSIEVFKFSLRIRRVS